MNKHPYGVGSHVKMYSDPKENIGTVISIGHTGCVTVRFDCPRQHLRVLAPHEIYEVSDAEWKEFELVKKINTGNPTIDNAPDNGKSIEQQIAESIDMCEVAGWLDGIGNENGASSVFDSITGTYLNSDGDETFLSKEDLEALNYMYKDMALATEDWAWLEELTN